MHNREMCFLFGILAFFIQVTSGALNDCSETVKKKIDRPDKSKPPKDSPFKGKAAVNCTTVRATTAKLRHQFEFVDPDDTLKIYRRLACMHCQDTPSSSFVWYFVPRQIGENPFRRSSREQAGSTLNLFRIGTEVTNNDDYCMDEDRSLIIINFDARHSPGIYYCSDADVTPDVKYIWYHVDSLIVPAAFKGTIEKKAYMGRISKYTPIDKGYVNMKKIDKAFDEIIRRINVTIPKYMQAVRIKVHYLTTNDSDLYDEDEKWTSLEPECGNDLSQHRFYKCRLELPRTLVDNLLSETDTDLEPMKLLIWAHYDEALKLKNFTRLAWKVYFHDDPMVPPQRDGLLTMNCYSTILKPYAFLFENFKPMKGLLTAKKMCPGINPREAMALFQGAEDMGDIKEKLMGEDIDMPMKVSFVNVEGTRVAFACGDTPEDEMDCRALRTTVLWKKDGNIIYYGDEANFGGNTYVNRSCSLIIPRLKLLDSGRYDCFLRMNNSRAQWRSLPTFQFYVVAVKDRTKLSSWEDVLKSVVILGFWTMILIFVWLILMIAGQRSRRLTRAEVRERKAMALELELEKENDRDFSSDWKKSD